MSNTVLSHSVSIEVAFGGLTDLISWCNGNCINHWDYSVIDSAGSLPGKYEFHFKAEYDYVTFMLWKK